jgi:hypothetical protein
MLSSVAAAPIDIQIHTNTMLLLLVVSCLPVEAALHG